MDVMLAAETAKKDYWDTNSYRSLSSSPILGIRVRPKQLRRKWQLAVPAAPSVRQTQFTGRSGPLVAFCIHLQVSPCFHDFEPPVRGPRSFYLFSMHPDLISQPS